MECLETQDPDYWKSELTRSRMCDLPTFVVCSLLSLFAVPSANIDDFFFWRFRRLRRSAFESRLYLDMTYPEFCNLQPATFSSRKA